MKNEALQEQNLCSARSSDSLMMRSGIIFEWTKKKAAFTGLTTDFIGKISQVGDTFPPINKQLYITCRELICYYILKEYCTQVQLIYL